MTTLAAVIMAAALGGGARFLLAEWIDRQSRTHWPWGIWSVNLLGSLAIGLLAATASLWGGEAPQQRWLIVAGAGLGSFTTVSSFSLQTLSLWRDHRLGAVTYVVATVLLCPLAAGGGLLLGRMVLAP